MRPRYSDSLFVLRALGLFALFVGSAWITLKATSGSHLGTLLGPIAAQLMMALVIFVGSRLALRGEAAPRRSVARRRLRPAPLILIACGGFLVQAAVLVGTRLLSPASVSGMAPKIEAPAMWVVLFITSVVGAPLLEELFFRGMLQPLLSRRHVAIGLVTTALLFGIAHGFQMPLRVVPAFVEGLLLGGVTLLTGRLRGAMLVHALNNALVLSAAIVLALRPVALLPVERSAGSSTVWVLPAYAAVGLLLIAWGFYRMAHQPRIATPTMSLATR